MCHHTAAAATRILALYLSCDFTLYGTRAAPVTTCYPRSHTSCCCAALYRAFSNSPFPLSCRLVHSLRHRHCVPAKQLAWCVFLGVVPLLGSSCGQLDLRGRQASRRVFAKAPLLAVSQPASTDTLLHLDLLVLVCRLVTRFRMCASQLLPTLLTVIWVDCGPTRTCLWWCGDGLARGRALQMRLMQQIGCAK